MHQQQIQKQQQQQSTTDNKTIVTTILTTCLINISVVNGNIGNDAKIYAAQLKQNILK